MKYILFGVFALIFTAALVATHIYLYRRLVRDTGTSSKWRTLGQRAFLTMGAVLLTGVPAVRFFELPGERYVGLVSFGWMGLVAISVGVLLCTDFIRLLLSRTQTLTELDQGRRIFLSRGIAGAASATALTTGASGVALAMADPELKDISVPIKGLPKALEGLRIVQLSDIHFGPTLREEFADHLVQRVNALKPDIVAITGDMVDGLVSELGPSVRRLTEIQARHGIFFVTGNHEYYSGAPAWVDALTEWGVRVLRNECVTIEHEGAALDLLGVDDWRAARFVPDHGYDFSAATRGRDTRRPSVLLSHQPKAIHDAARGEVDLVLCGHTHGGQIWPGKYLVKLVQPYVSGLHRHNERTWIYVHCGTGYWGPPVRVGVPAEIAQVTLTQG
jgi:hypothetical protein